MLGGSVPRRIMLFLERKEGNLLLKDDEGFIFTKAKAIELMQELLAFYEQPDVDQTISQYNLSIACMHGGFDFRNRYYRQGKFAYEYKTFRPDRKRDWSFICDWCNKKVSSKEYDGYYRMATFSDMGDGTGSGRTCSEACARHWWDEMLTETIKERFPNEQDLLLKELGLKE